MKREPAGGVEVAVRRVRPGDEERIASLSGQLGYPSAPDEIRSRLEPILGETLGVILFQEQVLRVAMSVAGFTGGADSAGRRVGLIVIEAISLIVNWLPRAWTPLTATSAGLQTLKTSSKNALFLFNLDVALEWDARNDGAFRPVHF